MEELVKKILKDKSLLLKEKEKLVAQLNYTIGKIEYIESLISFNDNREKDNNE